MKKYIYSFIITLALFSCGSEKTEETTTELNCELAETISYKTDVLPILKENCYECHSEEQYGRQGDGHKLEGYEGIKKHVDKKLVMPSITHANGFVNMPYRKAKLDTCKIAVIGKWIAQGALNN